jgi:signal peptidase I
MSILIFLLVSYLLLSVSLKKLFEKAGREGWKAYVPGLNFMEWCDIIGRPKTYALWLLFPIVNIFIYAGMAVDMARSFGKNDFWHAALAVLFAPALFFMIGSDEKATYQGKILDMEREFNDKMQAALDKKDEFAYKKLDATNPFKKNPLREWIEAIVFAVFAAAFIRMFLIEAYVIPTSSMEGSLLVGDFLFVSKAHYGIRTPQTVVQVPLLHNRIPGMDKESYLTSPSLPYFRFPALQNIERNDPVVFNWPEGDSVYVAPDRSYSLYQLRKADPKHQSDIWRNIPLTTRPMDKEDHYIKRCIAIAGDSMEIRDRQVYINGKAATNPSGLQYEYQVKAGESSLNLANIDALGVNLTDNDASRGQFNLNNNAVEKIKGMGKDITITPMIRNIPKGYVFPQDTSATFKNWGVDNYGPLFVPKAGATVPLTAANMSVYRRVIGTYEHNKLEERGGKIYINGQEATSYTFKQDYYWMMGDNRHNSEDSRFWGFVPAENVVGKPLFIWFSTKNGNFRNGINWKRLFTGANKM